MRAPLLLLSLLLAGLAFAGGIALDTSVRFEFTDCAVGGSASQNVTGGTTYLARVTDADVWVCYAGACAAGGERLPVGSVFLLSVPGPTTSTRAMSCRSAASTGDYILTRAY